MLKKNSNQKLKLVLSTLVTIQLSNIAFHLQPIWLQTLNAIDSESRLTSFPSFCVPPSEVAALFNLNLRRCPFLQQVVYSDLLLCTGFNVEHAVLFLRHIFDQRPMNDRKIEQSYGCYFGWQQLLRAEVHHSFITTTVQDESQVTPQGRHRQGSNWRPTASSSMPLPTWTRHPLLIPSKFHFT